VTADQHLARECRAFARYLSGRTPSDEVEAWYRRADPDRVAPTRGAPAIDRALLAAARWGAPWTRMADGYARFVRPVGPLRRRLTLMLAILENAPDTHPALHSADVGRRSVVVARLVGHLAASGVALVSGLVVFGPVHLVLGLAGPRHTPATDP